MPDIPEESRMPFAQIPVYIFNRDATAATTGFFSCHPQGEPSFKEAFEQLCDRPHDTFLHKYLLKNLASFHPQKENFNPGENARAQAVWQTLLEEYLRLNPDEESRFREFLTTPPADHFTQYTPLPILAQSAKEAERARPLARAFRRHLAGEAKLPDPADFGDYPLPRMDSQNPAEKTRQARNILREEYDKLKNSPPQNPEPLKNAQEVWREAEKQLQMAGLAEFPEMRHEASLSPIALLRQWPINIRCLASSQSYILKGVATSYGRGLSLAQARASLRMEIVERFAAFANIQEKGNRLEIVDLRKPAAIIRECPANLAGREFILPCSGALAQKYKDYPFYWFPGVNSEGETVLAPLQAVFLFSNLAEAAIFENGGSSGLGAGTSDAQARLSGLLECVERDAHAITPVDPRDFFQIASRDAIIQGLLEDYRARGIHPIFQDIASEIGVPAYRCVILAPDRSMIMASAAALSGKKAALSALTETPWPYSWATPAPFGRPSLLPARNLPMRFLEDLPDYSLDNPFAELRLLENLLRRLNINPVYCNIGRTLPKFPVYRVFLPEFENHAEFDELNPPSPRLLARWALARRKTS